MAEWNKEQQQVIDSRNASVLVSAAAGSGKTAVLVERILQMVMDEQNPCDIDEFLVVTFTNAAAAQMREKISGKLEKAVGEHPENQHLVKQLSLLHKADITTIDSFCLKVVKENFHAIGVDSSFSIMDGHLMELLKEDILEELFQEHYEAAFQQEQKEDSFLQLIKAFGAVNDDSDVKKMILNICKMAESLSEPEKWLEEAKENNHITTDEELNSAPWLLAYLADIRARASALLPYARDGVEICNRTGGCGSNLEVAENDIALIQQLEAAESYGDIKTAAQRKILSLRAIKKEGPAKENYQAFSANRGNYINDLKALQKEIQTAPENAEAIRREIQNIAQWTDTLISLCLEFRQRLTAEKEKRKQYEFSDISHMALRILCQGYDESRNVIPSEIGKNIAERYREIFIDEYQDSNFIQEDILNCVSRQYKGEHNMFMVGDVKQSIYKFRMARPDLFLGKYDSYVESETDDQKNRLINLKRNYRSRPVVLDAVNYIFFRIMKRDLGGILYDENAALKYGELYPDTEESVSDSAELLLVYADEDRTAYASGDGEEQKALEYEAQAVAQRIQELTDPEQGLMIWDEEKKQHIRAGYGDVCILLRKLKGTADIFVAALEQRGIPVQVDNPSGYFDAMEVVTMLSMLNVIDNSRQDVPLAAVLLSPLGQLDNDELTLVSACSSPDKKKKDSLYDKCHLFLEQQEQRGESSSLGEKLQEFLNRLSCWKEQRSYCSISQLIQNILELTHYDVFISSLPQGQKRLGNIHMLMEKAEAFEAGNNRGLFLFLRYMEKIRIHDLDFGEAQDLGEGNHAVRITTMHKSKGLEYPVAFVSGLGQPFVQNYKKGSLALHQDFYIATQYVEPKKRVRHKSFMQKVFHRLLEMDSLAEEQRVLYVAMTRAREKLILTGSVKTISQEERVNYSTRTGANRFLDWILPCVNQDREEKYFQKQYIPRSKVLADYAKKQAEKQMDLQALEGMLTAAVPDREWQEKQESYHFQYPYQEAVIQKVKLSVSEIKKMAMYQQGLEEEEVHAFVANVDQGSGGARRGTVIHKLMELLDFQGIDSRDKMKEELEGLMQLPVFSEEDREIKGMQQVIDFYDSELFHRMQAADRKGRLHREAQFTVGIPANQLNPASGNTDMVVVQGIVDAYFYEGEDIILMDYKTDAVKEPQTLIQRYKAQLDCYGDTLERLTGCKVKEKLIYSFALNRVIAL